MTYFGDALCKKYYFLLHMIFNLTIEWTPQDAREGVIWLCPIRYLMIVLEIMLDIAQNFLMFGFSLGQDGR